MSAWGRPKPCTPDVASVAVRSQGHDVLVPTDLLYLDRPRARRLLGEVDGGVIEQVVSSVASRRSGHLRAGVAGLIEGGGEVGGDATTEETLSMDDALFSVLEEPLEKAELLTEAAGFADRPHGRRGPYTMSSKQVNSCASRPRLN